VGHARLLLAATRFSGEISVQPMVDRGRSEGEDSDGGGLDGRWWLTRENRRFEASVADENRGLFRPDEGARTMKTAGVLLSRRLETFLWWFGGFTRSEMGDRRRERESPARGERGSEICYSVNARMVYRCGCRLWTVGSRWTDPAAVISWICKLIGRSGWAEVWSGVSRCIESLVHCVTWCHRI